MNRRSDRITEVNLALGGGGAKGFVHLGVLQEIVEQGIKVSAIVGTSIGAIIGALFVHYSSIGNQVEAAQRVSEILVKQDFWRLADFSITRLLRGTLLGSAKFDDWLRIMLAKPNSVPTEVVRFKDLPLELTITATNANTGECLELNRHTEPIMSVDRAVRASMSIPWVFKEVKLEVNHVPILCWDGGTTGNCRFDLATKLYPGRPTIASSVTYRGGVVSARTGPITFWLRPFKVLDHTSSILLRSIERTVFDVMDEEAKKQIILVQPSLIVRRNRLVSTYDFHIDASARREMIENGKVATRNALAHLLAK